MFVRRGVTEDTCFPEMATVQIERLLGNTHGIGRSMMMVTDSAREQPPIAAHS